MKDENNEFTEKPALVEEMGLLEGQKIIKSPPILPPIEWSDEKGDGE